MTIQSNFERPLPPELWEMVLETTPPVDILNPFSMTSETAQILGANAIIRKLNEGQLVPVMFFDPVIRDLFIRTVQRTETGSLIKHLNFTGMERRLPLSLLSVCSNLTTLIYRGPTLTNDNFKGIKVAAIEKKLQHLTHLELSFDRKKKENSYSYSSAALANITRTAPLLDTLVLKNMCITFSKNSDYGQNMFQFPRKATCLVLRNVGMNNDGLNMLIRSGRNLNHLDLSFNNSITPLAIGTLLHHKNLTNLESLTLRGVCKVTRSDDLSYFIRYAANPNLKMLDISHNRFTIPQQLFFNTAIFPHLTSLGRLLISFKLENGLIGDSLQDLIDDMPELEVLNKDLEE